MEYVHQLRSDDMPVSTGIVAMELLRSKEIEQLTQTNFNMYRQRVRRMLRSNNLSMREGTHVAQNTRWDTQVCNDWRKFIHDHIKANCYTVSRALTLPLSCHFLTI